jgi:hypothetical protein
MADLPTYLDFEEKRAFFSNGEKESFIINTKGSLDKWFKDVQEEEEKEAKTDATALIFDFISKDMDFK